MSTPKISARIDKDGNVHLDVSGVPGASCTDLTDLLVQGLGDVEEQQFTEEYEQELPDYVDTFETEE
jgi:hypothetical protein